MAAIETLNDKTIRAAIKTATETGKAKRISDGGGLYLDARPTGSGWWRLRYWIDGKEGMVSLGTYPEVPLALARNRRKERQAGLATGKDPSIARREEKAERARQREAESLAAAGMPGPGTFEFVAREWWEHVHCAKVSEGHAARTLTRFENDVFPTLGRRPIAAIEAPELLACLRKIEARGAIESAHRAKDACGQVFRYGIATGACVRNPAADLRDALKPVVTKHLAAIVEPKAVGALLRDMMNYQGHPVTRAALTLSALLLLRPGELRHMEWAWVDFDAAMVTVPSEVMKRKKAEKLSGPPHLVPLAKQAVDALKGLHVLTGTKPYVFPALTTGARCMSENTVRSALRRLGYGNDDMTAHGFRATARTMIAERLGIADNVIEAQLAHAVPDDLGRAYNRTQFLEQRRAMMTKWADYLDQIRAGAQVVQMPERAA